MIMDSFQFVIVLKDFKIEDKDTRRKIEDSLNVFKFSFINPILPPNSTASIAPMMSGDTEHGHARIQIIDKNIQLFIAFDDVYRKDRSLCFNYAHDKIDSILKTLKALKKEVMYAGIVVQYLLENLDNGIDLINRNSIKIVSGQSFFNFSKKFSIIYKEKYYINFVLSNLIKEEDSNPVVGIRIDVNDRYSTDVKNQISNYDDVEFIENIQKSITEKFLNRLINEGEVDFDETIY